VAEVERGFRRENDRHRHHEPSKDTVFYEPRPSRYAELNVRHLVQELLHEAEGTRPPAQKPSRGQTRQPDETDDTERNQTGARTLPYYSERTGKNGDGARMAIQDGKAYGVPLEEPQIKEDGQGELHLQSDLFQTFLSYVRSGANAENAAPNRCIYEPGIQTPEQLPGNAGLEDDRPAPSLASDDAEQRNPFPGGPETGFVNGRKIWQLLSE
jgi:hypothetical protein